MKMPLCRGPSVYTNSETAIALAPAHEADKTVEALLA